MGLEFGFWLLVVSWWGLKWLRGRVGKDDTEEFGVGRGCEEVDEGREGGAATEGGAEHG